MTALANSRPPSPLAVFRNRAFTLMWGGELIATIGSALSSLAASILILNRTGSALSVGPMLMATVAPSLLVGPLAGVFVDRVDRAHGTRHKADGRGQKAQGRTHKAER